MASFREHIDGIYRRHGSRHILPFIGAAYDGAPGAFRVLATGENAYLWKGHPAGAALSLKYLSWWADAGHGETNPFYKAAYHEVRVLAATLQRESLLFRGLGYDDSSRTKSGLYGTNFVKVFLANKYKDASKVSEEHITESAPSWRSELSAMLDHDVFPHLILVFGQKIWEPVWQSLHPDHSRLPIVEYTSAGEESPVYHHANRIRVQSGGSVQTTLLLRLTHPSAYRFAGKHRRDGAWLLAQPDMRRLAEIRGDASTLSPVKRRRARRTSAP